LKYESVCTFELFRYNILKTSSFGGADAQNRVSSRIPRNGHDPEPTSYIPMIPIKVSQILRKVIKMHQNF